MRISDWSSDVCSSDLKGVPSAGLSPADEPQPVSAMAAIRIAGFIGPSPRYAVRAPRRSPRARAPARRSEEHTSELQSLMRSSYAVFCLKKKKHVPYRRYDNNQQLYN